MEGFLWRRRWVVVRVVTGADSEASFWGIRRQVRQAQVKLVACSPWAPELMAAQPLAQGQRAVCWEMQLVLQLGQRRVQGTPVPAPARLLERAQGRILLQPAAAVERPADPLGQGQGLPLKLGPAQSAPQLALPPPEPSQPVRPASSVTISLPIKDCVGGRS